MTAEFEVNGNQTTVRFEFTADTTKVQAVVTDAAHWFYNQDEGEDFESLTNQQKLNVMDKKIKRFILDAARSYYFIVSAATARDQAIQDCDNNYNLGD